MLLCLVLPLVFVCIIVSASVPPPSVPWHLLLCPLSRCPGGKSVMSMEIMYFFCLTQFVWRLSKAKVRNFSGTTALMLMMKGTKANHRLAQERHCQPLRIEV
jgi:hypothetical protein